MRWSDIVEEAAPFVLLRLTADTGEVGVAEITPKPTWCGVNAKNLIAAVEEIFVPMLKKLDLGDPAKGPRGARHRPENNAAKTLIDNACWDLYAARQRAPAVQLWNGNPRVELSWAVTRQAPAAMAAEAVQMVERYGFRTLKVKGGQGIDVDAAGIREIRAAVGDGIRFYVDANGATAPNRRSTMLAPWRTRARRSSKTRARCLPTAQFRCIAREQPHSDPGRLRLNVAARRGPVPRAGHAGAQREAPGGSGCRIREPCRHWRSRAAATWSSG